jgi:hypothetical protein
LTKELVMPPVTLVRALDVNDNVIALASETTLASMLQVSSTAFEATDAVTPVGAVVKTTRAAADVAIDNGDWTPLQTTIDGDLRTRDDDLNTTLATMTKAESSAFSAADLVTPAGAVRKDARAALGTAATGEWVPLQTTATGDLRVRDDDNITAQASLLAAVQTQAPYSNVLAGYLTLSGSAEPLIPQWVAGVYEVGRFVQEAGAIYYCIQQTTDEEPGLSTTAFWYPVTPRAVTLWVNDDGSDVKRGSALRQESTLFAGGMKEKLSVDTDGLLAMYVIGTALAVLELEVAE